MKENNQYLLSKIAESKPAKKKLLSVVDTLGEAEKIGGLKVVAEPVLVSNTGTGEVVVERVELVTVLATVVGGTVVVLVEVVVLEVDVVLEVEEAVVVVDAKSVVGVIVVSEEVVVVDAKSVVGEIVVSEKLEEATILARRFFSKMMSSSHEIFCTK